MRTDIFKTIFKSGFDRTFNQALSVKILIFNGLSIAFIAITLSFLMANFTDVSIIVSLIIGAAIGLVPAYVFSSYKIYDNSSVAIVTIANFIILSLSSIFGAESGIHFFFFPIICYSYIIFESEEKWKIIYGSAASVVCIALLYHFEYQIFPQQLLTRSELQTLNMFSLSISIFFTLFSLFYILNFDGPKSTFEFEEEEVEEKTSRIVPLKSEWPIEKKSTSDIEKKYSALLQYSTDITSIIDLQGSIIYQSPSFFRIFEYRKQDILNVNFFEFIHPEDRSDLLRFFSKITHLEGIPQTTEFRFQKVNGHWVVLEATFTNLSFEEHINGIIINAHDITEKKIAVEENSDKSQMLKGIISNMPVITYKIDEKGIFTDVIGEGMMIPGFKPDQLLGKKVTDLFADQKDELLAAFHGDPITIVTEGKTKNKQYFMENYVFPDSARKGGLIGFALDITEKKLSEIKQQEYATELERINNNLDQFAHIVSHDLKAPLRAISHLVAWIEEDVQDNLSAETVRNMKLLRERVQKMQALIKGILEYSKANTLNSNLEEINVDILSREIITMVAVPSNFKIQFDSPLPVIVNNKTALEQVFSNLISNAVKYNNKEDGLITLGYNEVDDQHQFYVGDNGPGIPKEYHNIIFEIFQTLQSKEKVDSTGVGLAIVKKIIEEQGGKIWLDSDHGKGAKFYFSLPKRNL